MSIAYRSSEPPALLIEPTHRRIRLKVNDRTLADTVAAIVIYENGGHPVYYLPKDDFVAGALKPGGEGQASPLLGRRQLYDLEGVSAARAWAYDGVPAGIAALAGFVSVEWSAVRWFEEDEEIFRHPRNVYRRVDTIQSSRLLEVFVDGQLVARSNRAIFLFETGFIPRYYFPAEDILGGSLSPSDLTTYCPYKGTASYQHFDLDGRRHENIVWHYPEPTPESARIKGLISFYNEKVDEIRVTAGDTI